MTLQHDPASIWTRYWQSGQYEGRLSEILSLSTVWRDYFSTFPAGARLLDLAAGAGDAAELAAGMAKDMGRHFGIDAVDAASIPPAAVGRLRELGVRLIGDIYLNALPFESGSYDGVFSQFGIEYGERPAAFREAARMLSAGGRGLFMMHHRESTLTRACAERLSRHRVAIGLAQCFAAAERVFKCHLHRAPLSLSNPAEAQFRNEVSALRQRLGMPASDPNLIATVSLLSDLAATPARYDPADALRCLQFAQADIESWRLRQEAQQKVALDPAQLDAICGWLAEEGLDVLPPDVIRNDDGEIVAWVLRVSKPGTLFAAST